MERTPRMLRNAATARQAAARSMVLLKNKDNTLPLVPDGENPLAIAVFGVGQIRTVKGGTGSGEVNSVDNISFLDGLSQCDRLAPDALLARRYRSWCLAHPEPTGPSFLGPASNCSPEMPLDELDLDAYAQSCAAAVLVISRIAGEGGDMTCDPGALALTETESAMIRSVCEHFSRTVLVLNTPGYIELADVLPALGAVVFAGLPGQQAGPALADVLTGTVPPSGHLSDTWPLSCSDYPNMDWFGSGDENGISHNGMTGLQHQINVPYHDDIYVGYRYFDTFGLPVLFPFGHGLTYGDPLLTGCSVACTGDTVSVSAQIRNRSADFACSEVVQVYVSCPSGKLEQPYQRLAAFCKTEDILPDSETDVHLRFSLTELSSFDEARSSYVLEPGYYDVRVGFSSRETRVAGSLYLPCEQIVQKLHGCTTDLPEDFFRLSSGKAVPITYPGEAEELEHSRRLAIRLSARLVETETVRYRSAFRGCRADSADLTLYDVKNGDASLYALTAQLTDSELCRLVCGIGMDLSGIEGLDLDAQGGAMIPQNGDSVPAQTQSVQMSVPGAAGQTADLWEEYRIPPITLSDGPAGLRLRRELRNEDGEIIRRQLCTAFPTGSLLACSWDPSLLQSIGDAIGTEMQEYCVDLWLAPGMNLHRNPRCGRNFEYFSEDPLLTGLCAAGLTRGVQSHGGCGVTLKHFACNNQEYLRDCSNDLISERALRELYLKGFEIAVRTAAPRAVMTSYNDINGVPAANSYDLCTAILRDEWGFDGLVMTDWGGGISHPALSMWAGNDMIQPGGEQSVSLLLESLGRTIQNPGLRSFSKTLTRPMLECSALHILSFILRSDAFHRRTRGIQ